MLCCTVRQGSSPNSWNTIARSVPGPLMRLPFSVSSPELGLIKPSRTLRNVLLPQPDGPTTDRNSPS